MGLYPLLQRSKTRAWLDRGVLGDGIIPALVILCVATQSNAQPLPSADWPTTVQQTVQDILAHMSPDEQGEIRNIKREDLIRYHFNWGTGVRNRYGLWRGNAELIISACGQPCHPEDASMKIMEAVWDALHK
jgi:hypothetical protein